MANEDMATLVDEMVIGGNIELVANNPLAQFGTPDEPFVGAELMPESLRESNAYQESGVRWRTIVANNGTRYSPVQWKKGELVSSFLVTLAESDIGSDLTAREYDIMRRLVGNGRDMQALVQFTRWLDVVINRALLTKNEVMRWQAIINGLVVLKGNGGYYEEVTYANPTGHRVNVGGTWSNNAYDPYTDIFAAKNFLASKGFSRIRRIITKTSVLGIMAQNAKVQSRGGTPVLTIGGAGVAVAGAGANLNQMNGINAGNGLPAFEVYDRFYNTSTGQVPFIPDGTMVIVADAQRDVVAEIGETAITAPEMLGRVNGFIGYMGIGIPAGRNVPGRRLWIKEYDNKPPRIVGEGWQTSGAVILESEAFVVLKLIA